MVFLGIKKEKQASLLSWSDVDLTPKKMHTEVALLYNRRYILSINATRSSFSQTKQCLFLVFWNNFEEITITSLYLLKQLDYSLSSSMRWYLMFVCIYYDLFLYFCHS